MPRFSFSGHQSIISLCQFILKGTFSHTRYCNIIYYCIRPRRMPERQSPMHLNKGMNPRLELGWFSYVLNAIIHLLKAGSRCCLPPVVVLGTPPKWPLPNLSPHLPTCYPASVIFLLKASSWRQPILSLLQPLKFAPLPLGGGF